MVVQQSSKKVGQDCLYVYFYKLCIVQVNRHFSNKPSIHQVSQSNRGTLKQKSEISQWNMKQFQPTVNNVGFFFLYEDIYTV